MKARIGARLLVPLLTSALAMVPLLRAQERPSLATLPEGNTAAFAAVIPLHHDALMRLAHPADAGIWLVQDSTGHLISSGVLPTFPTTEMTVSNYAQIVPGAAGLTALEFGYARTSTMNGCGPFRVAFVTVAPAPHPSGGPS